jgi:predicted RNA-binding Zn ribbon-like protein
MTAGELVALVNDWGTIPREVGARDPAGPAELTAVADRLHPVFAAERPDERVRLVNAMLTDTAVRPAIREDGSLRAAWTVPRTQDAVLAAAALALRDHLAAYPDRLGVCADHQCADVYVDASPAGHRRFCSVTCQNRTRVAAYRRRQRGG